MGALNSVVGPGRNDRADKGGVGHGYTRGPEGLIGVLREWIRLNSQLDLIKAMYNKAYASGKIARDGNPGTEVEGRIQI